MNAASLHVTFLLESKLDENVFTRSWSRVVAYLGSSISSSGQGFETTV